MRHTFTRTDILEHARQMVDEYQRQGLTLTLRQLYYQFVARGLLPNGQQVYKRIGDTLTEARYVGQFPIEGVLDRGRSVHRGSFTEHLVDVDQAYGEATAAVRRLPDWYVRSDRWFGQETFVSVWVEKEALAGIFEQTCDRLGVSWFAGKGYPSVSALWDFIQAARAAENEGGCKRVKVLYFGDHDPDGWEIPRSSLRGLRQLMETYDCQIPIEFERVALLMDQIQQYNPPPFPAKETSARYNGYVKEHGTDDAWELDALEPVVLRKLIEDNVNTLFDRSIYDENQREVRETRRDLRELMRSEKFQVDAGLVDE